MGTIAENCDSVCQQNILRAHKWQTNCCTRCIVESPKQNFYRRIINIGQNTSPKSFCTNEHLSSFSPGRDGFESFGVFLVFYMKSGIWWHFEKAKAAAWWSKNIKWFPPPFLLLIDKFILFKIILSLLYSFWGFLPQYDGENVSNFCQVSEWSWRLLRGYGGLFASVDCPHMF